MTKNKKYDIAFSAVVMDMFHEGHFKLLKQMYKEADKVVIFMHDDYSTFLNKGKFPIQDVHQRADNLSHFVDRVIIVNHQNPSQCMLPFLKQNEKRKLIYMRGDDWKNFPGKAIIQINKIPIKYKKYTKGISSTKIRSKL